MDLSLPECLFLGICVRRILKSSNNPHLSVSLKSGSSRHSKKPADRQMECCNYTQEGERTFAEIISVGRQLEAFQKITLSLHLAPFRVLHSQCYFLLQLCHLPF